jgi:carbamoylphosphate synthase large subunit
VLDRRSVPLARLSPASRAVDRCFRVTAPNDDLEAYLGDLLRIIADEKVDLVLPVSEEALHVTHLAGRLPDGVRLWSAPREQIARYHDKLDFNRLAARLGLAVPATYPADAPEAAELAAGHDFVVKPRHSCSGIGLRLARAGEALFEREPDCAGTGAPRGRASEFPLRCP